MACDSRYVTRRRHWAALHFSMKLHEPQQAWFADQCFVPRDDVVDPLAGRAGIQVGGPVGETDAAPVREVRTRRKLPAEVLDLLLRHGQTGGSRNVREVG